jgi:hypothetical protein
MKYFVWIEWARPIKGRYSIMIFKVIKNKLQYISETSIGYWMTRWPESEIMNHLSSLWYIGKQYIWYYHEHYGKSINIKYIIPRDKN